MPITTINESASVPLVNPQCSGNTPFPASYEAAIAGDPTQCVAEDPCLPDGTTLWHVMPCSPVVAETVAVVAVSAPPTLPETGTQSVQIGLLATVLIMAGLVLRRVANS
jgi:LPXTG-motif cell wall-anchored protein